MPKTNTLDAVSQAMQDAEANAPAAPPIIAPSAEADEMAALKAELAELRKAQATSSSTAAHAFKTPTLTASGLIRTETGLYLSIEHVGDIRRHWDVINDLIAPFANAPQKAETLEKTDGTYRSTAIYRRNGESIMKLGPPKQAARANAYATIAFK